MPLNEDQIEGLMKLIGLTRERELTCDECLALAAEFAERELAGRTPNDALEAVQHHLDLCFECREEYEALLRLLRNSPQE